jgi:hypothetical protein
MKNNLFFVPTGQARSIISVKSETLEVHTYIPMGKPATGILFLFDGVHRNAAGIRDKAIGIAERYRLTLVAPCMDQENFPKWRYHHAGIVRDQILQPKKLWTFNVVQSLIDYTLEHTQHSVNKVIIFGHSAGGQMISRICAYTPLSDVNSIIIANPSSYVMPLLYEPVPYGFKDIFHENRVLSMLRTYLAAPMTIYLGMEDTQDLYLSRSKYAMHQGKNRLERGRHLYQTGMRVARKYSFEFSWRLLEIPGIGHSSRDMLSGENFSKIMKMYSL